MWNQDFQRMSDGQDLVLLQEAVACTPHDVLFEVPRRMEWIMARSHANPATFCETGVKTGSVVPCLTQKFFISPDVEPVFKTPKMLLATTYALAGTNETLLVINVHAINFVGIKKYNRHISQLETLLKNHGGPIILAGDFNTWNAKRFSILRGMAEKFALLELPLTRKARLRHMFQFLDHVFYRGLEVIKAEFKDVKSSDHDAISVRFCYK